MYNVLLTVMDIIVYSFWSGCLSRFCGSFLTLKRHSCRREGGAGAKTPPEGRKEIWRNGCAPLNSRILPRKAPFTCCSVHLRQIKNAAFGIGAASARFMSVFRSLQRKIFLRAQRSA